MPDHHGPLSRWSFRLAITGAVAVMAAPLAYRVGIPLAPALLAMPVGVLIALVALLLSLMTLVRGRRALGDHRYTVAAAAISSVVGLWPLLFVLSSLGLPAIHDITTDIVDPPLFAAVVPLRADAPNSLDYEGVTVGDAQREAYPDLESLMVSLPLARVVDQVGAVVEDIGWELVAVDLHAGVIEATDTTMLFGFKDDIVVRVRPAGDGALVDVRSVSRVGVGDLGTNAARVRAFLKRLALRAAAGE
jgi:uncharacterized protein (DUF1499 family)